MPVRKRNLRASKPVLDQLIPDFAVKAHQIVAASVPHCPAGELLDGDPDPAGYRGRPYAIWRDNPELARMINERLAGSTAD